MGPSEDSSFLRRRIFRRSTMKVSLNYNGLSKRFWVSAENVARYSVQGLVQRRTCEVNGVIAEKKLAHERKMQGLEDQLATMRKIVRLGKFGGDGHRHSLDRSAELEIYVCELEQKQCSERM